MIDDIKRGIGLATLALAPNHYKYRCLWPLPPLFRSMPRALRCFCSWRLKSGSLRSPSPLRAGCRADASADARARGGLGRARYARALPAPALPLASASAFALSPALRSKRSAAASAIATAASSSFVGWRHRRARKRALRGGSPAPVPPRPSGSASPRRLRPRAPRCGMVAAGLSRVVCLRAGGLRIPLGQAAHPTGRYGSVAL